MKLRMIKRLTAALLCVAMLAGIPALAVFEDDALSAIPAAPEVNTVVELPEWREETPLISEGLEVQAQPMSAAVIDVTVPTTLSIHMDANGDITCGDIVITNNGTESVVIAEAQVIALNGWTLVDYPTTSFTDANKGQHKVALQLRSLDSSIAANGGQTTINVSAKIPYQGAKVINADIAQVVLVLGVQAPDASIDWEYTIDGDTITLTKYIGENLDVVVHDKYYVGGKTYKTAIDVSAYFRRGPFNISDKQYYITSISFDSGIILPADMKEVFNNCSAVTSLNLKEWDTSNVTNMSSMFYCCDSLAELDLSSFDTSRATNMGNMFDCCLKLQTVTLGDKFSFNGGTTSRLTNLPTPDPAYIPGADGFWYTADGTRYAPNEIPNNVAATYYAVKPAPCDHAYGLWDRSNYPYWTRTCSKCGGLQTVEAPQGLCELRFQLETDSGMVSLGSDYYPISFSEMGWRDFYGIDISKFFDLALSEYNIAVTGWKQYDSNYINSNISDPSNASLFVSFEGFTDDGADYATIVLLGNPVTTAPEASTDWEYTTSGNIITLTKYIGSSTDMVVHNKYMANGKLYSNVELCEPPQNTDRPRLPFSDEGYEVSSIGPSTITAEEGVRVQNNRLSYLLAHLNNLTDADLSGLSVSGATSMNCFAYYCTSLANLDVSGYDTSKVTDMTYAFRDCSSLISLDLSSWDLSSLAYATWMFEGCTNLKTIYVKDYTAYDKLYSLNTSIPYGCNVIIGPPTSTASLDEPSYYAMASVDAEPDLGPPPAPEPVQYQLTISGPSTVDAGYTTSLDITKTPEDDAAINWTSSDETIATVDEFGVVTGIGTGEVTISAQVGETVCQWVMTVTDIPDVEADLEYRGEGDTPILPGTLRSFLWLTPVAPIATITSKSNTGRGTFKRTSLFLGKEKNE